jgi:hypothetical protein
LTDGLFLTIEPLMMPISLMLGRAFGEVMFPLPAAYGPEPRGVAMWFGVVLKFSSRIRVAGKARGDNHHGCRTRVRRLTLIGVRGLSRAVSRVLPATCLEA